jgi:hypothetical protein
METTVTIETNIKSKQNVNSVSNINDINSSNKADNINLAEFFIELYKNCSSGFIAVTLLSERKTFWVKVGDCKTFDNGNDGGTFDSKNDNKVLNKIILNYGHKTNVYFGIGLRKKILPNGLRGGESDILCVTALYADIDI